MLWSALKAGAALTEVLPKPPGSAHDQPVAILQLHKAGSPSVAKRLCQMCCDSTCTQNTMCQLQSSQSTFLSEVLIPKTRL